MSVNESVRERLPEGSIIFDKVAYDNSIVGVSHDGRVVYDINKMIQELCKDEDMSAPEALEWIEYNAIRSIPYLNADKSPVIIYPLEEFL